MCYPMGNPNTLNRFPRSLVPMSLGAMEKIGAVAPPLPGAELGALGGGVRYPKMGTPGNQRLLASLSTA